jgi:hypothetical protein
VALFDTIVLINIKVEEWTVLSERAANSTFKISPHRSPDPVPDFQPSNSILQPSSIGCFALPEAGSQPTARFQLSENSRAVQSLSSASIPSPYSAV